MKRYMGLFLLFLGMGMLVILAYLLSPLSKKKPVYSPYTLMESSWNNYKSKFIDPNGRIIDHSQGDVTTSEGQSYAMLQAVWVDDKGTFDKVWQWTDSHLKRPYDALFGWRWGQNSSGSYGFLPGGGSNSASDADSNIALALILASRRWANGSYLNSATPIINDIWNKETADANGSRYLIAGNWANQSGQLIIDPSYFTPYSWRIFATVDTSHDWMSLINPAFNLLTQSGQNPLGSSKSAGLPPDWVAVNKISGTIQQTNISGQTTNYAFDAMRIPWNIAVDYLWNKDPQAKQYLSTLGYLNQYYQQHGNLALSFYHDGIPVKDSENPAMYATALAYFVVEDPSKAQKIYQDKILSLYSNDQNSFKQNIPYYETNWLWFGAALYNHDIIQF